MSQATDFNVLLGPPADKTVMAERMFDSLDALLTLNSGVTRPAYAEAPMLWASTATAGKYEVYLYDGTGDVLLYTVDTSAHTVAFGKPRHDVADVAYTIASTDQCIAYTSLTAARIATLPAASAYPAGKPLVMVDGSGSCSATNTITLARAGSDTINGATSYVISTAYGGAILYSDGASKWTVLATGGGGASSTGLTGTVIAKTAAYTLVNADKGKTVSLGGTAFYTLTVGAATGFDADFMAIVTNTDSGRGKTLAINGLTSFILWPGQSCIVANVGNAWKVIGRPNRWLLSAGLSIYVRSDGNDGNDGLANSAGGAFATFNAAIASVIANMDVAGQAVTLWWATAANYTASITVPGPWVGGGALVFDFGSQTLVTAGSSAFLTAAGPMLGSVTIQNVTLSTTGSGHCIYHAAGTKLAIGTNVTFGACAGTHIFAAGPGVYVAAASGYTISGSAGSYHWGIFSAAYLKVVGTVTLTGTPSFGFFLASNSLAIAECYGITFSGSATGTRYNLSLNSVCNTNGGGASYLPGNAAGSTATGGQYF